MSHFFSQKFEMPYELADGKEIIIKFIATFYAEFLGLDYSGNSDQYGDFYADEIDLEHSELGTDEIIAKCKDFANDNKNEPEPTEYSFIN